MQKALPHLLLLLVSTVIAAPTSPGDSALRKVSDGLARIAEDLKPDVTLAADNGTVALPYKTRKFMVHAASKSGEFAEQAREIVGPDYDGLIVRVRLHEGRYSGAAKLPSGGGHHPYWKSFVNAYPVARGKQCLHVNILYGSSTDEKLITRVQQLLESVVDDDPDVNADDPAEKPTASDVTEIVLIDDNVQFRPPKDISFDLLIRNVSDGEVNAAGAVWGLTVVWDGKTYPQQPDADRYWNGPTHILPRSALRTSFALSEHRQRLMKSRETNHETIIVYCRVDNVRCRFGSVVAITRGTDARRRA